MDQNKLEEFKLMLEKIELKNGILKDEKDTNQEYQDLEARIKELREAQKAVLERDIPEVLSELESLKKEFREALKVASAELAKDKEEAKSKKKQLAKFIKLKHSDKFGEFSAEVSGILELNKGE